MTASKRTFVVSYRILVGIIVIYLFVGMLLPNLMEIGFGFSYGEWVWRAGLLNQYLHHTSWLALPLAVILAASVAVFLQTKNKPVVEARDLEASKRGLASGTTVVGLLAIFATNTIIEDVGLWSAYDLSGAVTVILWLYLICYLIIELLYKKSGTIFFAKEGRWRQRSLLLSYGFCIAYALQEVVTGALALKWPLSAADYRIRGALVAVFLPIALYIVQKLALTLSALFCYPFLLLFILQELLVAPLFLSTAYCHAGGLCSIESSFLKRAVATYACCVIGEMIGCFWISWRPRTAGQREPTATTATGEG